VSETAPSQCQPEIQAPVSPDTPPWNWRDWSYGALGDTRTERTKCESII